MNYKTDLKNIEKLLINTEDGLKKELYGLFSVLILSKKYASKNLELESIMKLFNLEFKEYVYKSRTILLSRIIRVIEKNTQSQNEKFVEILNDFISNFSSYNSEEQKVDEKKKKKKKNIFDDIFNQLG